MADKDHVTTDTEILKCKLQSDKRWNKMEIEIQKIKDDLDVMTSRLNKQAAMVNDIQSLSQSVALLASNMDGMLKEQVKQSDRLLTLEQKPLKRADSIVDTIVKLVITAGITIILAKIGLS